MLLSIYDFLATLQIMFVPHCVFVAYKILIFTLEEILSILTLCLQLLVQLMSKSIIFVTKHMSVLTSS
jgi:hypothetical protein